jgi:hypothetical protein
LYNNDLEAKASIDDESTTSTVDTWSALKISKILDKCARRTIIMSDNNPANLSIPSDFYQVGIVAGGTNSTYSFGVLMKIGSNYYLHMLHNDNNLALYGNNIYIPTKYTPVALIYV